MEENSTIHALPYGYRIMAIAPFGAAQPGLRDAVTLDATDADAVGKALSTMSPGVTIPLPKEYCPDGFLFVTFSCLDDFTPEKLMQRQPCLAALAEALRIARSAHGDGLAHVEVAEQLRQLLPGLSLDCTPPERQAPSPRSSSGGDAIDDLLAMVDLPGSGASNGSPVEDSFTGLQRQIEEIISKVTRRIFTNPEFRQLESAWRGAALLFEKCRKTGGAHKVEVSLASCEESSVAAMLEDLQRLPVHDLPNMVLLDFPVSSTPRGLEFVETVLDTTDRLLLPMAIWCGPDFFDLESWSELGRLSWLPNHLESARYAQWRRLRNHPGAPWVMLLVNRIAARPPYSGSIPGLRIPLTESQQLWINPVWGLGALVAMSVLGTGWPVYAGNPRKTALSGVPLQDAESIPLEVLLSEDRLLQFQKAGITPLTAMKHEDTVFLTGIHSMKGDREEWQLFLSHFIMFLFRVQHHSELAGNGNDAERITETVRIFFSRKGSAIPDDLDVTLEQNTSGGTDILHMAFTPPTEIIRADRIELNLHW